MVQLLIRSISRCRGPFVAVMTPISGSIHGVGTVKYNGGFRFSRSWSPGFL